MTKRVHETEAADLAIAVVGGGAAGLTAAHLLSQRHRVTLYERDRRLGGHAHTFHVADGPDAGTPLDVGFMVLNDRNYPTMHRLLAALGVADLGPSEMSFGYCAHDASVQYALNFSPTSPFAPAGGANAAPAPALVEHMGEILRFMRHGGRDLRAGSLGERSLGDYLRDLGASDWLVQRYVVPMAAAIWSTRPARILRFPAATFLEFYENHGLLAVGDGPRWQHVRGGSARYVAAIERAGRIARAPGAARVTRAPGGVTIESAACPTRRFDAVVLAAHADQSLRLLADPTEVERRALAAWEYQENPAVLHWDEAQLPPDRRAWASWNYRQDRPDLEGATLSVTYHLNRLQMHTTTARQYFLTMNGARPIPEDRILARFDFEHPTYTAASIAAQAELRATLGENRTYYCGSYLGHGFHEAAIRSGADVAALFGVVL